MHLHDGRDGRRRRSLALMLAAGLGASLLTTPAWASTVVNGVGSTSSPAAKTPAELAAAKAMSSGKPVVIDTMTTASSQTTANPDGTFTLTETATPTRTRTAHGWTNLDATLHRNPDGSISPSATASPIRLSGGGNRPLATMTVAQRTMSVSFPVALPTPTLSGATATYSDVLPSVDLVVTVDTQGGFSDVLVVKNATAAAKPALASLAFTTKLSPGLTLHTDSSGSIAAVTPGGTPLFTAPPPRMWDSASGPATSAKTLTSSTGTKELSSQPSSMRGPGTRAHQASLRASARGNAIVLTPDPAVLKGPDTVYPVYIDPQLTANNGIGTNGWATIPNPIYLSGNWWKQTPDPDPTTMQVGDSGTMWSHTLMNLPIPVSTLSGANYVSATLAITETLAYSCTPSWIDLYAPSATLTPSNATWNAWNGALGSVIDRKDKAYGWHGTGSTCTSSGPIAFDNVLGAVTRDVAAGKKLQTFALTGENEANDTNSWKELDETTAHLTIVYQHTPNVPTRASTSPGGACQTGDPGNIVIGNDDVTFSVYASTRDAGSPLITEFYVSDYQGATVYDSGSHSISTGSSGYAVLTIPRNVIQAWHTDGTTPSHEYSWNAKTIDGSLASDRSPSCNFTYNPASPISPGIAITSTDLSIGQRATITLAQCTSLLIGNPCPADKPTPVSYVYQLDNGPTAQVKVTGPTQQITLSMTHIGPNIVTAYAIAAGGNPSEPISSPPFTVSPPATPYADGDVTGTGNPDLLYAGTGANPGLWAAASDGTGHLDNPVDIGVLGTGINTAGSPADWAGADILHGNFGGNGVQDVLAYYPTGQHAGAGQMINGHADTTPLQPVSGSAQGPTNALSDLLLGSGTDVPIDLVAAGNASETLDAHTPPDLIGVEGSSSDGYELDMFSCTPDSGVYDYEMNQTIQGGVLAMSAPDNGTWGPNWSLAAAQPGGNPVLFALNTTTGTLWESANPTKSTTTVIGMAGTWTQITTLPWTTGIPTSIASADVNTAGNIELWTIAGGTATAYVLSGTTLTVEAANSLIAPNHEWPLTDAAGSTTAADTVGNTPAALSATGATWSTDNQFIPNITLDGSAGDLTTTSNAVNPSSSFTLDAWVDPTKPGGVVLSQDGTSDSDFVLYPNASQWEFGINNGNTTAWSFDGMVGGSYQLNVWSHLTITYDAARHLMAMYVNGSLVATGTHAPVSNQPAHGFRIGDDQHGGTPSAHFGGQISEVRTWNGAAVPPAPTPSPAGYHQALTPSRILDTRTNVAYSDSPGTTPIPGGGTLALNIINDPVTTTDGESTTIPSTAIAVALDATITNATSSGYLSAYPGSAQRPLTSAINYTAGTGETGYQIVPIGQDGKIDFYNSSTGTVDLIVDITGYYTTDPSQAGRQADLPPHHRDPNPRHPQQYQRKLTHKHRHGPCKHHLHAPDNRRPH